LRCSEHRDTRSSSHVSNFDHFAGATLSHFATTSQPGATSQGSSLRRGHSSQGPLLVNFSQFHSLSSHCAATLQSLRSHFGCHFAVTSGVTSGVSSKVTSQPPRSRFEGHFQPLSVNSSRCCLPPRSHFGGHFGGHFAVTSQSLRSHFAATSQSLCSHCGHALAWGRARLCALAWALACARGRGHAASPTRGARP
jgi:hypothetical protein